MLAPKVCLECGETFTPHSAIQKYCNKDHYRNCPVCNKLFLVPREKLSSPNAVCSKECQYRGVASGKLSKRILIKVCDECGDTFETSHPNQRFCKKDHYGTCSVCGKTFLLPPWQLGLPTRACSPECKTKLAHQTFQERYSKESNPENHAALIAKMEHTMLERYGVKNALSTEGKKLFNIEQKMLDKYGVTHPSKSAEIMAKRDQTNLERYGFTQPLNVPEIREKAQKTLLEKYGVDNYAKSVDFLKQVITDPEKAEICAEFRSDPIRFVESHFSDGHKPTLVELAEMCGIRDSSIGWILDQVGHPDIVTYTYSRMEDELYEFLRSFLGDDAKIERNTFKIITPYELDLYLPEYEFAIECNPTITHNSTIPGWGINDEPKSPAYHMMKTELCDQSGVFLFHIFGYEWSHHSDIIKSMIRNILNKSLYKLYARNTQVKEISDKEAMDFLNANHRQGGAHSKIRLGLFHQDELVSLMTFSRMRKTIGTGKADLSDCYELVRFCNKLNTNVVGGASKLFQYFMKNYNPIEIRSFSDRAHTKGNLYPTLGFQFDHTSDPGYMWVDLKTDRGYARNNSQKKNIKKFLNDESIDLNKTEVQIMQEHNFVQVFDSGVKLWIWRKEE